MCRCLNLVTCVCAPYTELCNRPTPTSGQEPQRSCSVQRAGGNVKIRSFNSIDDCKVCASPTWLTGYPSLRAMEPWYGLAMNLWRAHRCWVWEQSHLIGKLQQTSCPDIIMHCLSFMVFRNCNRVSIPLTERLQGALSARRLFPCIIDCIWACVSDSSKMYWLLWRLEQLLGAPFTLVTGLTPTRRLLFPFV